MLHILSNRLLVFMLLFALFAATYCELQAEGESKAVVLFRALPDVLGELPSSDEIAFLNALAEETSLDLRHPVPASLSFVGFFSSLGVPHDTTKSLEKECGDARIRNPKSNKVRLLDNAVTYLALNAHAVNPEGDIKDYRMDVAMIQMLRFRYWLLIARLQSDESLYSYCAATMKRFELLDREHNYEAWFTERKTKEKAALLAKLDKCATLTERLQIWSSSIDAPNLISPMYAAIFEWLWNDLDADVVLRAGLPDVLDPIHPFNVKHFCERYVSPDYLVIPPEMVEKLDYGVDFKKNTPISVLMLYAYAVFVAAPRILKGETHPYTRNYFVHDNFGFGGKSVGMYFLPPDAMDRIEKVLKPAYDWWVKVHTNQRGQRLKEIKRGEVENCWFIGGRATLEGDKGTAMVETDLIYPYTIVIAGGDYGFNFTRSDINDRVSIRHGFSELPWFKFKRPYRPDNVDDMELTTEWPINAEVEYDYTLEGIAKMRKTDWFARQNSTENNVNWQGIGDNVVMTHYSKAIYYFYPKAEYRLYSTWMYDSYYDIWLLECPQQLLVVLPPENVPPEKVVSGVFRKRLSTWGFKTGLGAFLKSMPWYVYEFLNAPDGQELWNSTVKACEELDSTWKERWKTDITKAKEKMRELDLNAPE